MYVLLKMNCWSLFLDWHFENDVATAVAAGVWPSAPVAELGGTLAAELGESKQHPSALVAELGECNLHRKAL